MPAPVKIELSSEEKKQLEGCVKSSKTPIRLTERSKIVLLAADSYPNYQIAEKLGINHSFVNRVWRGIGLKPHLSSQFKVSNIQHLKKNYVML